MSKPKSATPTEPKPPRKPRVVSPEVQAALDSLKAVKKAAKAKAWATRIVSKIDEDKTNALRDALADRAANISPPPA